MIPELCENGGDLHYAEGADRRCDDGSYTAVCGACGRGLYAARLGANWMVANDVIEEEPW